MQKLQHAVTARFPACFPVRCKSAEPPAGGANSAMATMWTVLAATLCLTSYGGANPPPTTPATGLFKAMFLKAPPGGLAPVSYSGTCDLHKPCCMCLSSSCSLERNRSLGSCIACTNVRLGPMKGPSCNCKQTDFKPWCEKAAEPAGHELHPPVCEPDHRLPSIGKCKDLVDKPCELKGQFCTEGGGFTCCQPGRLPTSVWIPTPWVVMQMAASLAKFRAGMFAWAHHNMQLHNKTATTLVMPQVSTALHPRNSCQSHAPCSLLTPPGFCDSAHSCRPCMDCQPGCTTLQQAKGHCFQSFDHVCPHKCTLMRSAMLLQQQTDFLGDAVRDLDKQLMTVETGTMAVQVKEDSTDHIAALEEKKMLAAAALAQMEADEQLRETSADVVRGDITMQVAVGALLASVACCIVLRSHVMKMDQSIGRIKQYQMVDLNNPSAAEFDFDPEEDPDVFEPELTSNI